MSRRIAHCRLERIVATATGGHRRAPIRKDPSLVVTVPTGARGMHCGVVTPVAQDRVSRLCMKHIIEMCKFGPASVQQQVGCAWSTP